MSLITHCPHCDRVALEVSRIPLSTGAIIKLRCGHLVNESALKPSARITRSKNPGPQGYIELYPFQNEDLTRVENAGGRALLTYECGLGKTIVSSFFLANHLPELQPCAIIAKSAVILQWWKHLIWILGEDFMPVFLENGTRKPLKGIPIHLVSFDMCRRLKDELINFGFKTIIVDECQHIKDTKTSRTKAVTAICESAKHVLMLSATPLKNNGAEYFPSLNILRPQMFPYQDKFVRDWCETYRGSYGSKIGGIKNIKAFHETTKDFIFHRTRSEVLPDLPPKRRDFEYLDIDDEELQKAYDKTFEEFELFAETNGKRDFKFQQDALSYLNKMRQIVGLAKVQFTVDDAIEFLESTDRKLVIYVHHIDVGDRIQLKLNEYCKLNKLTCPLRLLGGMKPGELEQVKEQFLSTDCRILVASTLAAGEGLNLQPCADAIMTERQWNSVNEEQAEDRFSRPGATADRVNIKYPLAIGTVDDHLTEIVERKRRIVKEAITGERVSFGEVDVLNELIDALLRAGKPKWKMKKLN